jgi:hypothetical protein
VGESHRETDSRRASWIGSAKDVVALLNADHRREALRELLDGIIFFRRKISIALNYLELSRPLEFRAVIRRHFRVGSR